MISEGNKYIFLIVTEGRDSCTEKSFFTPITDNAIASRAFYYSFDQLGKNDTKLRYSDYKKLEDSIKEICKSENNIKTFKIDFFIIHDDDLTNKTEKESIIHTDDLFKKEIENICNILDINEDQFNIEVIFDVGKSFEYFLCLLMIDDINELDDMNKSSMEKIIAEKYNTNEKQHKKDSFKFWQAINQKWNKEKEANKNFYSIINLLKDQERKAKSNYFKILECIISIFNQLFNIDYDE